MGAMGLSPNQHLFLGICPKTRHHAEIQHALHRARRAIARHVWWNDHNEPLYIVELGVGPRFPQPWKKMPEKTVSGRKKPFSSVQEPAQGNESPHSGHRDGAVRPCRRG